MAELARRQGGVVALWQLLELGFTAKTVEHWVETGRLHRIHRGVYAVGHRAIVWKGRLTAAVIACGPEAVLSHRSAAAWWALLPSERARVDVTAPRRHRLKGIDAHTSALDACDHTVHEDIPITTIARTLLDLAEVVPARRLAAAMEAAERMKLFDLAAVHDVLQRSPGRRGHKQLRSLLSNYEPEPMTRSKLEIAFWEFIEEEQLPRPDGNALIGPYEVDILWAAQRVIVELDSREYHLTTEAFERDRSRDIELQVVGYVVIRVTPRKLRNERSRLAAQLRTLLARP
jgi:very-short-patch-repair endonuclease